MKDTKYLEKLEGITYNEWMKLKHQVEMRFEIKKSELLGKAQLTLEKSNTQSECVQD